MHVCTNAYIFVYCGSSHTLMWYGSLCTFLGLELVYWHLYVRLGVPGRVGEVSFVLCFCFVARVPGSLAGGFPVAVAGRALFLLVLFLL